MHTGEEDKALFAGVVATAAVLCTPPGNSRSHSLGGCGSDDGSGADEL
jgi:hypothetical protein